MSNGGPSSAALRLQPLQVRPADRFWPRGAKLDELFIDGLWIIFFVFATSAGTPLGIDNFERYVWLPADFAVLALFYFRQNEMLVIMRRNLIFLSWAALASISFLWSLVPGLSLYHGIQLLLTMMVGFMLILYADLLRIMQILFVALLICAIASILYAFAVPAQGISSWGEWKGLYPHKNVLGGTMAILLMVSMCLFMSGWRPILCIVGALLGAFLLMQSRSGTAMLSAAVAITAVPLALFYRKGWTAFAFSAGLVIAGLALGFWIIEESGVDLVKLTLTGLDKDETLSGRTILWDFGVEAYESRPWLGFGYKGYWEGQGTTAPLLRFVLGQRLWFFHNNFVEVAVAFGFIGPIVLGLGLFVGLYRCIRAYILDPQYTRLFSILVMVHILAFCFAENPLFTNHGFYQILFIIMAGSAIDYGMPRRRDG